MRSRKTSQDQLAEVARRRLELLSAELAQNRPEPPAASAAEAARPRIEGLIEPPAERSRTPPTDARDGLFDRAAMPSGVEGAVAGRHAHRSVGLAGRLSGWVRDRLPPTLQGGASLSVAHLAVVVVALVVGVLATVWWVSTGDDGDGEGGSALPAAPASALVTMPSTSTSTSTSAGSGAASVPATPPSSTTPGRGASTPAPTAAASSSVVVDVAGKVRRPGIATLPLGARVVDALEAAGGARRGVRLGSLNLARVLTDGEQIVVGMPAPAGVAASAASAPSGAAGAGAGVPMVNINTAGQAELEELPGIGPVTAQAILAFRSERGTFSSVDELLEVSGIGDATLADMAPFVTL